jgi:hypothetical protein
MPIDFFNAYHTQSQQTEFGFYALINTVKLFAGQRSLDEFDNIDAFVCNSMRPRSNGNHMNEMQRFADETKALNFQGKGSGLKMDVRREIKIIT